MINPIDRLTSFNNEVLPHTKFLEPRELIRISIKKLTDDDDAEEVKFYIKIAHKIYSFLIILTS